MFDNGQRHGHDRLLIATGSRPLIPGMDCAGVHSCWTLDDARKIMALAPRGARILQMGAGFIGCINMRALMQRGVRWSVVEMGDGMVPRMMGPTAGGMIKGWSESQGVHGLDEAQRYAFMKRFDWSMQRGGRWFYCALAVRLLRRVSTAHDGCAIINGEANSPRRKLPCPLISSTSKNACPPRTPFGL